MKTFKNQKGVAPILILVAVIGIVAFLAISSSAPFKNNLLSSLYPKEESQAATFNSSTKTFSETFDGLAPKNADGTFAPHSSILFNTTPNSASWDVAYEVNSQFASPDLYPPMEAQHGTDCAPPLATHHIDQHLQGVFICRDHLMTAVSGTVIQYSLIYLTPNALADMSSGEAVVKFDMDTLRTSGRDWVDFWVTPWEDNLGTPLDDWLPILNGEPKRSIHVRMDNSNRGSFFRYEQFVNHNLVGSGGESWWGLDGIMADNGLTTAAERREPFEFRLSKTHIKFTMPAHQAKKADGTLVNMPEYVFFNENLPQPLDFNTGVVQFGHHSYNPEKDCAAGSDFQNAGALSCKSNTWHWDNFSISPAQPFSIIKSDKRYVNTNGATVNFASPAPTNAFLRFSGIATIEVSFDNGTTWIPAKQQSQEMERAEHTDSYFMPIPAGNQSVKFRGGPEGYINQWLVSNISIWSQTNSPASSAQPSPSAAPSSTPAASAKPGDIDGNNKVDIFDYNILLTNFGKTGSGLQGDFDKNGKVDIFDFNVLLTNFGK